MDWPKSNSITVNLAKVGMVFVKGCKKKAETS